MSPTLTCKEPLSEQQVDDPPLATELFDEVQSPRCTFATSIATAKLPAWSRHVHGVMQYKMASNIQLTTGRDREIACLILLFR